VDAAASHFTAPDQSPMGYVIEIDKGLAFEETLSDVTHTIFDNLCRKRALQTVAMVTHKSSPSHTLSIR
jgi:hypothetical protein